MGEGHHAWEILKIGVKQEIQIIEHAFLARALFFSGQIGKEIASELYIAIAAVLAFVYRVEHNEEVSFPEIDIPSEMIFDETGKKYLDRKRMSKQSLGEMISTVCFAGVALVWFLYGMEYFKNDEKIKAAVLFLCSLLCF